ETAVDGNAKMMMRGAHILFASPAGRAGTAADPRIDRDFAADEDAIGTFTRGFDDAGDFMPERERQGAILGDVEPFIAAEREIAVLDVQIRVTDPAAGYPNQNFGAARYRALGKRLAQRRATGDKRLAAHTPHAGLTHQHT